MEHRFEILEDKVTTIYDRGKPVAQVIKYQGHDIHFALREMHGSQVTDLLSDIANQVKKPN